MLVLLSPAKSLDYDTPVPVPQHRTPAFAAQAHELVKLLRQLSVGQLGELMSISTALAELNHQRYAQWSPRFSAKNSRQAIFAFNGDVYDGLDAYRLTPEQLEWADEHLVMLSGLYGVLRPFDWMQPYRLEMGTALPNAKGKDLYAFWQPAVARYLNQRLADQGDAPLLVNLASQEYAKAVDRKRIDAPIVDCVFEEGGPKGWRVVGLFAKRARGRMARFIIEQRARQLDDLRSFAQDGYRYVAKASTADTLVFRRKEAA
jgi:cytoplasmic iron level regulating protein YaaA (DUF328/UPF0246 family)